MHIWSDDRFRSTDFLSTTPTPTHGLKSRPRTWKFIVEVNVISKMKAFDQQYHTRDSQKVRGHLYLLSHLSNVFKFYFIFRKRCFHFLICANIKQITAVVPEQIDFEHAWGSHSGTRQIWDWRHQTLSRNWPEIPRNFIKTDNPRKSKTCVCI